MKTYIKPQIAIETLFTSELMTLTVSGETPANNSLGMDSKERDEPVRDAWSDDGGLW